MTDRKISELTNITGADLADNDEFVVVDTSADETKAITYGELKNFNGTLTSDGLTVDTNTLHVDATNNRVGIGTTSPSAPIAAVGSLDILQLTGTSGNAFARFTDSDASSDFSIGADDGSGSGAGAFIIYDRNATAYRMAIDSSGNLLVGHTSAFSPISNGGSGVTATAAGQLFAGHAGTPLYVNREDSDGDIAVFRKDGTTVGSIGTVSNTIGIHGAGSGDDAVGLLLVESGAGQRIIPCQENFTANNGVVNLGWSTNRFKDLYLSGGVFLGGTGSANHLDDYEEGTWTPVVSVGSTSGTAVTLDINSAAVYTKIGNLVFINAQFRRGDATAHGGNLYITGLPFTSKSGTANPAGNMWLDNVSGDVRGIPYVGGSGTSILGIKSGDTDAFINVNEFDNGRWIYVTATYQT